MLRFPDQTSALNLGWELHPGKTKIVYCKDDDRRGNYPNESFDFPGPAVEESVGKYFVNFSLAFTLGKEVLNP